MTFILHDEDHTLGNALRYMIMKKYVCVHLCVRGDVCACIFVCVRSVSVSRVGGWVGLSASAISVLVCDCVCVLCLRICLGLCARVCVCGYAWVVR